MELIDTHCHIHFADYDLDPDEVIARATEAGITKLLCVGCTLQDSHLGIEFAQSHPGVWATIGIHPHEARHYVHNHRALQQFRDLALKPKVVAIGETGLDYHYNHSPRDDQLKLLHFQLDLAQEHSLPLIFHVREAFDDFFEAIDNYPGIRGVVHSFTGISSQLEQILKRGLFVGVNGIITFNKNQSQIDAVKSIPIDSLVLETDAPFLTPVPFRGIICEPKHLITTAEFLSELRGESLQMLARETTRNAQELFGLKQQHEDSIGST